MEEIHAHEVLHMMEGNSYSEESLKDAIATRFGADARFYACSASNMDIAGVVEFLKRKGKFMPAQAGGFTVDTSKVCNH